MPDGDNATSVNVYKDSLRTKAHTRNFPNDDPRTDIITLVEYMQGIYFTKALNWICEVCGYSYYGGYEKEVITDPCILVLEQIEPKTKNVDEFLLIKLDNKILNEYVQYPNIWFYDEGISLYVQRQFEVGFSVRDERITLPVRDELGNLVGVKARTVLDHQELNIPKYLYLYQVPKSLLLFGLDKSYPYIKEQGEVIVYESEKSVLKSFSYGFCNCVSIGGHELSYTQVLKLEKLGVEITFAFDKDITKDQLKKEADKFIMKERVYTIFEYRNKLLGEKDAPVDKGLDAFIQLYTTDKYKIIK